MTTSHDIATLFERFGGDARSYREISEEREALAAREKWPLLEMIDALRVTPVHDTTTPETWRVPSHDVPHFTSAKHQSNAAAVASERDVDVHATQPDERRTALNGTPAVADNTHRSTGAAVLKKLVADAPTQQAVSGGGMAPTHLDQLFERLRNHAGPMQPDYATSMGSDAAPRSGVFPGASRS